VPSTYTGLWKRSSIQLGDAPPYEDATVFWLQAEKYFADIRIPLTQPSLSPPLSLRILDTPELLQFAQFTAFAGVIDIAESWIRWNRTIDFSPDPNRVDQGNVFFAGKNLIESGEFDFGGGIQQYSEVWVPQTTDTSDRLVLELVQEINTDAHIVTYPKALLVAVGEHFIRIYDARFYPLDFVAPAPAELSGSDLQRFMRFQVDYGKCKGETPWQIALSNDPSRKGTALQARTEYQAHWQGDIWVETWKTHTGETLEHHWQRREFAGNLLV